MASAERYDAFTLMEKFRTDAGALGEALNLFIDRPDYGFVWLAYVDDLATGVVSVSLGIDTGSGALIATLRDLYVLPERRRHGIGSALLVTAKGRVEQLGVKRMEVVGVSDPALQPFFAARGFGLSGISFISSR